MLRCIVSRFAGQAFLGFIALGVSQGLSPKPYEAHSLNTAGAVLVAATRPLVVTKTAHEHGDALLESKLAPLRL